jgi:hypothetical protein
MTNRLLLVYIDGRPLNCTRPAMPAILEGQLSSEHWTDFDNKYDAIVADRKDVRWMDRLLSAFLLVAIVLQFILKVNSYLVGMVLLLGGVPRLLVRNRVMKELQELCEIMSREQTSVTFVLQRQWHIMPCVETVYLSCNGFSYIEVFGSWPSSDPEMHKHNADTYVPPTETDMVV